MTPTKIREQTNITKEITNILPITEAIQEALIIQAEVEHTQREPDMTTNRILDLKNIDRKSRKKKKSKIKRTTIQKRTWKKVDSLYRAARTQRRLRDERQQRQGCHVQRSVHPQMGPAARPAASWRTGDGMPRLATFIWNERP